MNILLFIFSLIAFIYGTILTYEIWFDPQRFSRRIDGPRNSLKVFLGFSYWKNGYVNWTIVKVVSIFILILSLIGMIISITGPIIY